MCVCIYIYIYMCVSAAWNRVNKTVWMHHVDADSAYGEKVYYARMARAILNKSCKQGPTKQQLYGHLRPISKTIQIRRTIHAGYCLRFKDELINNFLQRTPSHGRASIGRSARTYLQELICKDTGCSLKDLPKAIDDRDHWWERVWEISVSGNTSTL